MSNQIVISSGAKVRSLEGVLTGTAGIVNSVPLGGANGVATLDSNGKVPLSQLPASVVTYLGTWNAATNTPTLTNGVGDVGDLYICNVAGTVNFGAGPITFAVGDWVIYNGSQWQKSAGASGTVTSVAVTESGDALTITGSPITTAGTINIGFAGTGSQYIKGDGTLATFPTTIDQAKRLITEVYNSTGATLTKGTVVYINGGQGNLPTVTKAQANSDATSAQTYGVVQSDITNMNNGFVVVFGSITDIDTQAYAVGTQLYLSGTTAGEWTSTKPSAPIHLVYVGIVVRSHPTQGVVEIRIQNGYELEELHDVAISAPVNNQGIFYNSSNDLWENKSIATALGYTPANDALVVHLAGTETITGAKTFSSVITGDAGIILKEGVVPSLVGYTGLAGDADGLVITKRVGATAYTNLLSFTTSTSNTYSFPNASGTIALTSNLSSYVPYTGATGNVNLGTNEITASNFVAETSFSAKLLTSGTPYRNGYTTFSAATDAFCITQAISAGNLKSIFYDLSNLVNNTSYTYGLPAASGTFALLESTQSFSGSKTFTGAVSFNNSLGSSPIVNRGFAFVKGNTPSATSTSWSQIYAASGDNNIIIADTNNTSKLQFQASGTYTYTFPATTGTVALTSNLSSYVPYTGATTDVDLGAYFLTANYIKSGDIVFWKGTGTGLGNIGLGRIVPLGNNTTGQLNIGIGENSLFNNTTGSNNIAIGATSSTTNTTGSSNIGIGSSANRLNVTGSSNIAIGVGTLYSNTVNFNIAIGSLALYTNTTGTQNIAIGHNSQTLNSTGNNNTSLGYLSLSANTTGGSNTAIGNGALQSNTTGGNNVAIGNVALSTNTTSSGNTAIGGSSLAISTGSFNTAVGLSTLSSNTTGQGNVGIGYGAGSNITTGNNNTLIGAHLGTATMSNNIILSDGQANARFWWDGTNTIIGQSGNVGIGNPNPSYKLDVTGTGRFTDTLSIDTSVTMLRFGNLLRWGFQRPAADNRYVSFMRNMNATATPVWTIDGDNGNVGIGTSSPASSRKLDVNGAIRANAYDAYYNSATSGYLLTETQWTGVSGANNLSIAAEGGVSGGGNITFFTNGTATERMRITSGGELLIAKSSVDWTANGIQTENGGKNLGITHNGSENNLFLRKNNATGVVARFWYNATDCGNISISTTSTTYNTTSDYRLKEDFKELVGLNKVLAIKTYNYKWKNSNERMDGVIAHELQEILPYAVTGEKDEIKEDGTIIPQSVDYSKIVPVLVKAIQELEAKVSALENKA
jgi:hypothetical protein